VSDISKSWVRVCPLDQIPAGKALNLNINGQRLIITRCDESASIMQGFCSHMLYPLAGAKIDNCELTCGLHKTRFNAQDGSVVEWTTFGAMANNTREAVLEGKALRTFETQVEEGVVYILWPTADPDSVRVKV
jgi:nitrite reductase/ring-hydroxylating ferredoxin subunit